MSPLAHRFAGPAEFKQALIADFGSTAASPHQAPTAWDRSWDPALLRRMEAVLARHVGPIAAVLVRRSAVACHDLPTLCERLAEQVTNPRSATLGAMPAEASPGLIPEALVEASAKVLATYLGPIAPVLARRAAAAAPDRAAYFGTLEEAIDDPEKRQAVRTLLEKLH
jgi:serine/threonine-protein kinase